MSSGNKAEIEREREEFATKVKETRAKFDAKKSCHKLHGIFHHIDRHIRGIAVKKPPFLRTPPYHSPKSGRPKFFWVVFSKTSKNEGFGEMI